MKQEIALYLLAACLLFFWIFGQYLYFSYAKAAIVAACIYILCFVFAGAMRCLLWRAGKRRLACEDLIFCAAAVAAAGIGLYNGIGEYAYEGIALLFILFAAAMYGNGNAALCALVIALPACICRFTSDLLGPSYSSSPSSPPAISLTFSRRKTSPLPFPAPPFT